MYILQKLMRILINNIGEFEMNRIIRYKFQIIDKNSPIQNSFGEEDRDVQNFA